MTTLDAYITGLGRLVNVSAVTDLLNGNVIKGSQREDGVKYPCLTVFSLSSDPRMNYDFQVFDGRINIWVQDKKNGTVNHTDLSLIEAQIIPLVELGGWANGTTKCFQQIWRGTFGPFKDSIEADVHFSSIQLQSFMTQIT